MNLRGFCFLICLSFIAPVTIFAVTPEKTPVHKLDKYLQNMDKKFDKGALNFTAGLTETVRRPMDHYQHSGKRNRVLYAFQGAATGLVAGCADMIGGFFNAATSFLPQWEIPLPQKGIQAEKITGANSEVFGSESVSGSYTASKVSKVSWNL